jgi:zinc protease
MSKLMDAIQIPHQRFRLENGLEVILHPDERLPLVVVNVLYRVGSSNDPAERTGMAHLFEHLMFMGTKRVPENQFDLLMEQHGGSNNAFTSEDLTDYYSVGPARLLETFLWLEADRMASLAQALTRRKLDLQREVVLNERRQSYENTPYGQAQLEMPSLLYPTGHPYSWPIIGHSEHLRAVTVDDVRELFARFYSPRNASLVVAGQFDPGQVQELVQRYFGWIPAAVPVRQRAWPMARLPRAVRRSYQDKVELAKLYFAWHSPPHMKAGDAELDLAATILSTGKRSRLYQSLVYERRLALEVEAQQESRHLGSLFTIEVTAQSGVDLVVLEQAVDEIVTRFMQEPPSAAELERAFNLYEAQFVSQLERLSRRAELLNIYFATTGQPDFLQRDLQRYQRVDARAIERWTKKVLVPRRRLVASVVPEDARS